MEDKTCIIIVALVMLTIIEICALLLGYDGAILAAVVGIMGVVAGVPAGVKIQEARG
jgi:hypothetical protein